jgi:ketosteroid isomerase-like protein
MTDTAATLARRLVESFGDPDAIGALLADECEWWITPTVHVLGSPTVGRDAIVAAMRVIFGDLWGDPSVEVHHVISEGDMAAIRMTLSAHALFAEGRPYTNEYSVWVHVVGDVIDRVWEYLDVAWSTEQFAQASSG